MVEAERVIHIEINAESFQIHLADNGFRECVAQVYVLDSQESAVHEPPVGHLVVVVFTTGVGESRITCLEVLFLSIVHAPVVSAAVRIHHDGRNREPLALERPYHILGQSAHLLADSVEQYGE